MKRNLTIMAAAIFATGSLLADAKDDVQGGIKKLADASSYSWSTKTENAGGGGGGGGGGRGFGGGPSSGKAAKDGYAVITTTFGDNSFERVLKGDKSVSKNQDGEWQTLEEIMAARGGGNGNGGGRGRGRGGFGGANTLPDKQAEQLLAGVKELKSADGVFSGELTKEAVAARLNPFGARRGGAGGEAPAPPADAKGSAKFWVKDGVLSKYEFNVQGTMSFGGNDVPVNRTTTVEIKDVGTTKVEVPEEAKKKLQ